MKKSEETVFADLELNIAKIEKLYEDCSDLIYRPFQIHKTKAMFIYIDGLVDITSAERFVLQDLLHSDKKVPLTIENLEKKVISIAQVTTETLFEKISTLLLDGNAILFIDELTEAFIFDSKGFETRSITEPESETAIRGPREGFIENIRVNTSLIRRKIRTANLKILSRQVGEQTKTHLEVIYIKGIADEKVIEELNRRLDRIEIDAILESGYIEELIEDDPFSPFPQVQVTERPDTVAANLLEGRIAIVIDGTPFVIIVPASFWQLFQASEDYYHRFFNAFFIRMLRFLFILISLLLPAFYVATTTYHQEMIPTNLLLSVAASREAIPFPAVVEAFIMEISFEALREAGVRLPRTIGQAVSILGAIVVGSAAVEAGIVSAPMVIIVSLTGIASFTFPKFSLAIPFRLLRFPIMIFAAIFGLLGIVVAVIVLVTHLCKLRSFGVPYFQPTAPLNFRGLKDIFVRVPLWMENERPHQFVKKNKKRQKGDLRPSPKQK